MNSNCSKSKHCFWDKHEFVGKGVMCPIFYKPRQIVRKKREYYINQNITRDYEVENWDSTSKIIPTEIFYDDMFCSVECCLAWIEDHHNDPKYQNSKQILVNELYRNNHTLVNSANHWRLLKAFGGFLSIEVFRKFNIFYEEDDTTYENNSRVVKYKEVVTNVS